MKRDGDVFTAADVARFCGVDLKTIHHWIARGKLRHRKTDGGHARIERADLVVFLRAYEMPLPAAMKRGKPRVFTLGGDERARSAIARALARRFEAESFADAVDALVAMGRRAPQAMAAIAPTAGIDLGHVIARLRAVDATAHVRVVAIADESDAAALIDAGAAVVLARESPPSRVRDALAQLTGIA